VLVLIYLEIVLILTQDRSQFAPNGPYAQKSFGTYPMILLGGEAQVEDRFGPFGDSANLDAK
jgi:hypothetical protein